jgi:serine/threonine-protein kinase
LADDSASLIGQQIGHIRVIEVIGKGGMGTVYLGYDETLQRQVALKAIGGGYRMEREAKDRFLREARILSHLDHPKVCDIHDFIEGDGYDLLVLELVKGRSLRAAMDDGLDEAQKLDVARQLLAVLVAVHGHGVMHRDLKPDNVMITPSGSIKVLDFGIAGSLDQPEAGSSTDGGITGTISYMSPEQAMNEPTSAASDIYSLGLIFQEMFTGKPAFPPVLPLMQLLLKAAAADTLPISGLDPDLTVLINRMKSKAPGARPSSVDAAERLQQIIDKPVRRRWRRMISALAALVLVLISIPVTLWQHERWRAGERAALAQAFGREVRDIEWLLRVIHMQPRHDIRPDKAEVRRRMSAIEARIEEIGELAYAPVHYALGRGYLALGEHEPARRHLDLAWQNGNQGPEVAYARGRTLAALYQDGMTRLQSIFDEQMRRRQRAELERRYRDPALQMLQASSGLEVESPALIEGLIAFCEERYPDALSKAQEAYRQVPWLHEAMQLEADTRQVIAAGLWFKGDLAAAEAAYQRAGKVLQAGIDSARSAPDLYESECGRWSRIMEMRSLAGEPASTIEAASDQADQACLQALAIDADAASVHSKLARICWWRGEHEQRNGRDPAPYLQRAVNAGQRAVALDPESCDANTNLGDAYSALGVFEKERGQDPRPWFARSVTSLQRSLALDPQPRVFNNLAITLYEQAEYELGHGIDALPTLEQAIAGYRQTIELLPEHPYPANNLGNAYRLKAAAELATGKDPRPSLRLAISSYERAVALNPQLAQSHGGLGRAHAGIARYQLLLAGHDPGDELDAAVAAAEIECRISPEYPFGYVALGTALAVEAAADIAGGQDPSSLIHRSRETLQQALRVNPSSLEAFLLLAETELLAALWAVQQQRSPLPFLDHSQRYLETGLAINPASAELHLRLAETWWRRAEWQSAAGRNPEQAVSQGLAAAARTLEINPRAAEALAIEGMLYLIRARHQPAGDSQATTDQGRQALSRAYALNQLLEQTYR